MLIISRKSNESFIIETKEGNIEIVVTEITSGQAKIGIQAPKGFKIWRKELCQTIEYNQQAASETASSGLRGIAAKLK